MTSKRLWGIIRRMRNLVTAYKICKYIRKNGEVHVCHHKPHCDVMGKVTKPYVDVYNEIKGKRKGKADKKQGVNDYVLIMEYYKGKFFDSTGLCDEDGEYSIFLTNKGTWLTDNLYLPFTPKNLWIEIWSENKVIFTALYGVIASVFSVGTVGIVVASIKAIQWLISLV